MRGVEMIWGAATASIFDEMRHSFPTRHLLERARTFVLLGQACVRGGQP